MGAAAGLLTLPSARGPVSSWVLDRLEGIEWPVPPHDDVDGLGGDAQLALYLCYESHFSGLPGVVGHVEWATDLIDVRQRLEVAFVRDLRRCFTATASVDVGDVGDVIEQLIAADDGPSISAHIERDGTIEELRDVVVQRSAYQLKEADPHTFGLPRLDGRAKQLLATIQAGEYGVDAPGRAMHVELFAATMRALGLDEQRHAYLDELPATALAISNLATLFGMNRAWRGALVGHLAVFEMTSAEPAARYVRGLQRLGAPAEARRFYEVHALADVEHAHLAREMAVALARDEPELAGDIVFGAQCVLATERRFATALVDRWASARHHKCLVPWTSRTLSGGIDRRAIRGLSGPAQRSRQPGASLGAGSASDRTEDGGRPPLR